MAGNAQPVPVDFEDAGFDAPDVQRHDVLVSALDHVLSRTLEEIDRLHVARSANLDAIAAALGSAMTGIDMLYLSREPTPISGTSISHASWWAEEAPEPCDSETWLRAAIPEGQRSTTSSFAMEQFLRSQAPRSRNVSRANSASSYKGAPTAGGLSRPGSKQQRTRSPSSPLTSNTSPSTKLRGRGPPSPDPVKSAEHGLREELEIRRAQVAVAREMEAKDAAERERLASLQKQLKGRDYGYDHKGQVVVLNSVDPTSGPDAHAPSFRLATPETQPLSPTRGFGGAAAASKRQVQRNATKTKDRAVSKGTDYKEAKSNSQPNALETMSVTPGVTLRQGNQTKSGPPTKRGAAQGSNMSREEFERYAAQKAQAAQFAAMQQQMQGAAAAAAAAAAATAAAAVAAERSTLSVAAPPERSGVKGTTPNSAPRSAGGLGPLASLPDALPPAFGAIPKARLAPLAAPPGVQGSGVAAPRRVPPDVNPMLLSAVDWGSAGGAPSYDVPPALPFVKPSNKLRELEVGRNDMLPRERTNLATLSPPRTKPLPRSTGAAAR